jgi:membrane protease YdiL (CAAX protease family)
MKRLFWNSEERRLAMFWRVLFQYGLFFIVMVVLQAIIGMAGGLILMASGAFTADTLSNPNFAMEFGRQLQAMPVFSVLITLAALIAVFGATWVAGRLFDRRKFADFGFRFSNLWWSDFGFGLLLGIVLMGFIFFVERQMGWVEITGDMMAVRAGGSLLVGLLVAAFRYICVGIYEELLSRGYLLRNLGEGLKNLGISPKIAILAGYVLTSVVFGLMHAGNPNATLISTINLMIAGLFLGLGYILTGELGISIGLHITWNFFQGNVFGFPVSGMGGDASLINIVQGGPDLWTGGVFGPEAGLIGLVAIALGCILTLVYVRWRHGQVKICDEIAIYSPRVKKITAEVEVVTEAG